MPLSFKELIGIKKEVKMLEEKKLPALRLFHIPANGFIDGKTISVRKFKHYLNKDYLSSETIDENNSKISITSTVTCIKSLLAGNIYQINLTDFLSEIYKRFQEKTLTTTGLENGNPFTVGLLLPILKSFEPNEKSKTKYHEMVQYCITQAKEHLKSGGIQFPNFHKHGYLTYYNLLGLDKSGINVTKECETSIDWSKQELFKQISYFQSEDEEEGDVFQLGYNLLIQFRFYKAELRESIVDLALRIIFHSLLNRGVWEKRTPLFNYKDKGDAFPFSFELLNAIFHEFQGYEERLMPFEDQLLKVFKWTKKNAKLENVGQAGLKNEIQIWKSVSRQEEVLAESWATAEVYLFLFYFKKYLSKRAQNLVLKEYNGDFNSIPNEKIFEKKELRLPEINLRKEGKEIKLDDLLIERLFSPLKLEKEDRYSLVEKINAHKLARSGILFGPPGTGKTTYVKCIAEYLGWPLITINPSDFAKDGLTLMPRVASEIFEKLLELEDVVIFFDEMDELIKDRKAKESVFEQKFLTTTFLPKLQILHDKGTSIFLVATNYISNIDPAAKREGRFDFKIQILPPSFKEKMKSLLSYLEDKGQKDKYASISKQLIKKEESIKYSTRQEFKKLLKKFDEKNYKLTDIKKAIDSFSSSISLYKKIKSLQNADKENTFETD